MKNEWTWTAVGAGVLSERVAFVFSKPMDFLVFVSLLANPARESASEGLSSRAWDRWLTDVQATLSHFLSRELSEFFRPPIGTAGLAAVYFYDLWAKSPPSENISDFIARIAEGDPRGTILALARHASDGGGQKLAEILGDRASDAPWTRAKTYVGRFWPSDDRERMTDYLEHPEETQKRLAFLLTQLYENGYRAVEPQLQAVGGELAQAFDHAYRSDPVDFLSRLLKVAPADIPGRCLAHISPLIGRWAYLVLQSPAAAKSSNWVILGAESMDAGTIARGDDDFEWLARLFSDKTRWGILHHLSQRPWYGAELASALGVSPPAISYHIGLLLERDVVSIERRGRRYYYALNRERLDHLWERTRLLLLGEETGADTGVVRGDGGLGAGSSNSQTLVDERARLGQGAPRPPRNHGHR